MTKLDAGLMTSLPASDSGSAAAWGSKRINPQPRSCLCLTWSGYPSNDDDDDDDDDDHEHVRQASSSKQDYNMTLALINHAFYLKLTALIHRNFNLHQFIHFTHNII